MFQTNLPFRCIFQLNCKKKKLNMCPRMNDAHHRRQFSIAAHPHRRWRLHQTRLALGLSILPSFGTPLPSFCIFLFFFIIVLVNNVQCSCVLDKGFAGYYKYKMFCRNRCVFYFDFEMVVGGFVDLGFLIKNYVICALIWDGEKIFVERIWILELKSCGMNVFNNRVYLWHN